MKKEGESGGEIFGLEVDIKTGCNVSVWYRVFLWIK